MQRRRYQRGWVEIEGVRGRKRFVGRYRAADGSKPKIILGLVADMTLSEARSKIEGHVREIGSRPLSTTKLTFNEYWTHHYLPRHRVSWGEATESGYQAYLDAYLGPAFGNTLLAEI